MAKALSQKAVADITRFKLAFIELIAAGKPGPSHKINPWTNDDLADIFGVKAKVIRQWRAMNNTAIPKDVGTLMELYHGSSELEEGGSLSEFADLWKAAASHVYPDEFDLPGIDKNTARGFMTSLKRFGALQSESYDLSIVPIQNLIADLEEIPRQGSGPHFSLGDDAKIRQMQASDFDKAGNDVRRIQTLLPLIMDALDDLEADLSAKENAFPRLIRDIGRYRDAISKPMNDIPWGLVWGVGVRLEEASEAANRDVGRMQPALEDQTHAALRSLLTIHGPLMLATGEGHDLQEQADRLRMTRPEQQQLQRYATAISASLVANNELIEPEAAGTIGSASEIMGEGLHPERTTLFGLTMIKHIAAVVIGAAVVSSPHYFLDGTPGAIVTMAGWEVVKKSSVFVSAVAALGQDINKLTDRNSRASQAIFDRLAPFRHFVIANKSHFRGFAANIPSLHWMAAYLDYIEVADAERTYKRTEFKLRGHN